MIRTKMVGKKGTEKPIEIFVALFVILAVALVMLKLFQGQISQKQSELEAVKQEGKQNDLRERAITYCNKQCNIASNDQCSAKSLASFCLSYGSDVVTAPDFLDLNLNQKLDVDNTLMAGIGICEGAVPCHALVSSCCGQTMTASRCKDLLDGYWQSQDYGPTERADKLNEIRNGVGTGGDCENAIFEVEDFWFYRADYNKTAAP